MDFLIIQFIGAIAYAILTLSYFRKEKSNILLMEIIAYAVFAIHYYLLSGITGAICNLVGLFALLTIYIFEKNHLEDKKLLTIIFVVALIVINIITYQNIYSIFPLIASTIVILSFLTDNENYIRGVGLISAICWLIYAIVYKSYISIAFEAVTLSFIIVAYLKNRFNIKKLDKKTITNIFLEFKSIFVTTNVLKENERHANVVTATTMLNLFFVIFISWVIGQTNIIKVETINMSYVVVNGFIGLFIPAIICYIFKGEGKWIKYMLLGMFILVLSTIDHNITYITAFLMVIPVILSARYYRKNFTILISLLTFIIFLLFGFINEVNYFINIKVVASALLLYYVVVFSAVQISQSGKNMIRKQEEITRKGTRIETELNLANNIQQHMLPSVFPPFPEHKEIDIYASMKPAKEVGGDLYDMFLLDDKHLVISIADVSGKGIPAALFMMISKILVKNIANIEKSVDLIFNRVNHILCDGNEEDIFVTSWLGILDLETGKLDFVNAGHNPPLIYSNKDKEYNYLKTTPNMVMACMDNIKYEKHSMFIEPNDKIFLYTDGVVDTLNNKNEMFGEERLINFLNKHSNLNAKESIEKLMEELYKYSEGMEQFDDITMLQLNYKGLSKNNITKKTFKATISELPKVEEFVLSKLGNYNKKSINQIILVVEEVFTNISKYAYKDEIGKCKIGVSLDEEEIFKCTFEDSGIPFNPLTKEDPDLSKPSKDRKVGGLGIYLSKKIMDSMEYKYEDGKNILTVIKKMK